MDKIYCVKNDPQDQTGRVAITACILPILCNFEKWEKYLNNKELELQSLKHQGMRL